MNDAEGFIVANSTPNGYQISATTQPNVNLSTFGAGLGNTVGVLLVRNTDGIIRTLLPAATANLYLVTNALGQLTFGTLPPASVPDPLTVTTANITTLTVANETITAGLKFTGLVTGTIASQIGLDAGGNVVIGSPTANGVQCAMFFESATSPAATTPNGSAAAGSLLVIGNQLYDSGASLIGITNNQTLKVLVKGKYKIDWCGQVGYTSGGTGRPAIQLLINGVVVNNGNTRPTDVATTDRTCPISGFEERNLEVNDIIQFHLSSSSGTHTHVYELRAGFEKFG